MPKAKHTLNGLKTKSARPFTDREEPIQIFKNAIKGVKKKEFNVLVYYGVGGIGKTSLRKELGKLLKKSYSGSIWTVLDFTVPSFREQETALFFLRKSLMDKYKIQFPTFDLAYAVYWKKTHPQIPLSKENFPLLEEGSLIADIVAVLGEVPIIGLIPKIPSVFSKGRKFFKEWWTKRGQKELYNLPQLESQDIIERLPAYWASDLKDHIQKKSSLSVLFIDSYEALWEAERTEGKFFARDEWIRELISNLPEVLWVICGREKLRWEEVDPDWENCLEQHLIGGFTEEDSKRFLSSCKVMGGDIKDVVVEGSRGVPFYLDLAVDTYFEIEKDKKKPVPADFGKTPREIFERFVRHLKDTEIEILKVLSSARVWDKSLFKLLIKEFNTGYPLTALSQLCRFSFINPGVAPNTWYMHQLMQDSLQEYQEPELRKSVHRFLFDYYGKQLQKIDIKKIAEKHKTALEEAFYHGKTAINVEEFFKWFIDVAKIFNQAAQWRLLITLYEEIIEILKKAFGSDHPDVAIGLNNIAALYDSQGKYEEAEPLYKRALAILEKALGKDHSDVATLLNNLAALYYLQGKYEKAEPLYNRALTISEKALGKDHPTVSIRLNNLAALYDSQGRYEEAEPFYKRALAISEKALGKDHPDVAIRLNNLAELYRKQSKYEDAEPLYKRALAIISKALDKDHPDVAMLLNNLAALYNLQGKYAEAEPIFKQALAISEKAFGKDHPIVATSLNNLALLYKDKGKYVKAEPLYKLALAIDEKALGKDHPDVARDLHNLAALYYSQGKYAKAEPLYKRALAIMEKALGPDHPDVATVLENMAELYKEMGKEDEAEKLEEHAKKIRAIKR